jgi:hypothetical protein
LPKGHEKPPARFLLDDGELPKLIEDLEIVQYEEGWLGEDRHDAVLVARRTLSGHNSSSRRS